MQLRDIVGQSNSLEAIRQRLRKQRSMWSVKQKARYITTHFSAQRSRIIQQADLALQGMHTLPGTGGRPYFVGNPPDWEASPVNDAEYLWTLNRMYHWRPLLWAFNMTQEPRYAEKVVSELQHWIQTCQRPPLTPETFQPYEQVDPWRTLEVGIRMYQTWPLIVDHLLDSDLLTAQLFEQYLISVYSHAEVLSQISPVNRPDADTNVNIMEMLGLLITACRFPEFVQSKNWRHQALEELERCVRVQLTQDGGQIEGCPHYHNHCVYLFCRTVLVARANDLTVSNLFLERLRQSLWYAVHTFRPSGASVPWGDSDADTSAIQAVYYGYFALEITEPVEMIYSLADEATCKQYIVDSIDDVEDSATIARLIAHRTKLYIQALTSWQRKLKQATLRTSWKGDALSLFFACRTPVYNGHAHIDPMSFDFTALGKPIIVDPGRFTYRDDADRKKFVSATWHNTLLINDQEPFEYYGSWNYGQQAAGNIIQVSEQPNLLSVEAVHYNYEPAIHKRLVAIVDQSFVLVWDHITQLQSNSTIQIYFHIDSTTVKIDGENGSIYTDDENANISIHAADGLKTQLLPGKVSDYLDVSRRSTRVRFDDSTNSATSKNYVWILFPFYETTSRPYIHSLKTQEENSGLRCDFVIDGQPQDFIWNQNGLQNLSNTKI